MSAGTAARRSRFWLFAPPALLALLVAALAAAWFVIRARTGDALDAFVANESAAGRRWDCPERAIAGFPFRIEVSCARLAIEGPEGALAAGRLRTVTQIYQPRHTIFELDGPFRAASGGVVADGVGLARRTPANQNPGTAPKSGSLIITGIPQNGRVRAAYLVWQTIGGPDVSVVFEGVARTGTLMGGSAQRGCWNVNNGGAYRTYRATIPAAEVPGNGTYAISGVGGTAAGIAGRPDGQGASLIVIYDVPGGAAPTNVHLRFGAMTVRPGGPAMTHSFTGLSMPSRTPPVRALLVGIGDGESFADPAMQFAGAPVSAASAWSGTEGTYWDDARLAIPAGLMPAGTTARANSQGASGDCLTWGYAALMYRP